MALKQATTSEETPDTTALETLDSNEQSLTTGMDNMELGGVYGDLDDVPMRPPFLNISHAQGKFEEFPKGSVILGDDQLIAKPGEPLHITILMVCAYWKEYFSGPYDPLNIARKFKNREDVIKAGGTTTWTKQEGKPDIPPTFKLAMSANIFIRKPDNLLCEAFSIPIGDGMYTAARWTADKQAAAAVLPVIKNDRKLALRDRGIYSGIYELKTVMKKSSGGINYYVPRLTLTSRHTDDDLKEIERLMGESATIDINDEN